MYRLIFFVLAWAAAVHCTSQMQRANPVSVPHPGCTFYLKNPFGFLNGSHHVTVPATICEGSQDFLLPDNFNVSLVYADTEILNFNIVRVIVKDNYTPLPHLPHLRYFMLNGRGRLNTPRFPLNGLLIYNKNYIIHLELNRVNMSGLNKADFNGFVRLKYLVLDRCQITAIDKDIFEELGNIVDAPSLGKIFPDLEVYFYWHDIEQLDWAFLSPISRRLKVLNLYGNNLRNVVSTADSNNPVFLESIEMISLSGNKLGTLPSFIYESLNLSSLISFYFTSEYREQQFCENSGGCSCCELYNFTMWYRSNVPKLSYPEIELTCGGRTNTVHNGSFSPECGPADPPTRIPIIATPAPTHPQPTTPTTHPAELTESYPPTGWMPAQSTRQTDYQTTPAPGSQDNCQKIEPLIVTCRKGKVTFSQMKPNETDALVAALDVDITLRCRMLMHSSHTWLLPGRQWDERQSSLPVNVKCTKEGVTVSDDQPDDSEATLLTLTTTGNLKCRLLFVDYVNYLQAIAGLN